jgi:hypothetical protein
MPLVKVDMVMGVRSPEEIAKLADVVQEVMQLKFNTRPRDRFVFVLRASFLPWLYFPKFPHAIIDAAFFAPTVLIP